MAVNYMIREGVAVITLDNPPVNGLGHSTRLGIVEGIERAQGDASVCAVVLIGAGKAFSGGADITEFNTPKATQEPTLATVIKTIEGSGKPVVAAIHAVAMGGGLELALGAHYRVASPGAQIALPEVKLGLLPGAGGTQRLPRVVGLERALDMIVSGTPVRSETLADTALFDEMAQGDLLDAAIGFARRVADRRGPHPKVRDRPIAHVDAARCFESARQAIAVKAKHFPAPHKCIDAIEMGAKEGFDRGLAFERECFLFLVQTPESRALRHAFFAERAASKIADVPSNTPLRRIERIGVIGAGTMGGGIAMNFVNAGLPVVLLETKQDALDRGLATVRRNYEAQVKKGKLTPEQLDARMRLLQPTLAYADLAQADLIVEAVFEDLDVKAQVFRQLDAIAKPGAILASNTSTLDLDKIAAFTGRPGDVIGMHFFSPANVMKLLEVVRGEKTDKDVLATVMQLARKIGKTAVVARVCDGFIGNRMIEQYVRQALFMLEEGALSAQIDRAIENFGFAMGPFRMSDLAGNDIGWAIRKRRYREQPQMRYPAVADRLCEMGRFGQKTGAGWYDYEAGSREAKPSQAVNDMIVAYSQEAGIARRDIGDDEIVERLVLSLVNEGAKILEEGIAAKASDIDMVYLTGYGFPLWRGGPMFHADTLGLPNVERAMRKYAAQCNGEAWQPAARVTELAASNGRFNA
ncbi:3-hydroxybutyryl-CoA epimerase [Burkholderia sp. 8Y]|uniref:3-hydroxyacyl-CoA dehydrogenase NAD-binding domain-containing protein n=1 Tax=Burkholderia sp. 8Y TaxID=2653133 RepID=UPI0012F2D20D|nr:3-hydroxyacyl-CoA dehydrogenase NAD-binding domain-containing protein [Burkholderia sp. 8Y]VXB97918.1 3-hydroxybutyryl-CoA epimerase [Burkholderia sp. 8Y]